MRLVCGVGYNDLPGWTGKNATDEQIWLYQEWVHMLERCYSWKFHQSNPTYVGSKVCERWKTFSQFVSDGKKLPGYQDVKKAGFKGYSLDKDLLGNGSKLYSPKTCCWLSISDNVREKNSRCGYPLSDPSAAHKAAITKGREVIAVFPDGSVHGYFGTKEAARQLGSHHSTIQQSCSGRLPHTKTRGKLKGYTFYWKDEYTCP